MDESEDERSRMEDNDEDTEVFDENENEDGSCSEMEEDGDFYDDESEYEYNEESEEENDVDDDNSDNHSINGDGWKPFVMKSTTELIPTLEKRILGIAETHQILPSVAHSLLRHYRWSGERLTEALLSSPSAAVDAAGVSSRHAAASSSSKAVPTTLPTGTCTICMEDSLPLLQMACQHPFCSDCWTQYLTTAVCDGNPTAIDNLSCPQFKCQELVTEDEVSAFCPSYFPRYRTLQLRSFVELGNTSRWCPGAGCQRIAVSTGGTGDGSTTVVTCDDPKCGISFCLWCGEEPHAPLRCDDLRRWKIKNQDSSETANWILKNTKLCPGCRKPIEKNQGCNHMTCTCGYEFCWICMTEWSVHNGSYFKCNMYEEGDDEKKKTDADLAAQHLDKYLHYYQRYQVHHDAQNFAQKQLVGETGARMMNFSREAAVSWSEAEFLNTANIQLIECRRVLKFTYVFAYYMKDKALITERWADMNIERQSSSRSQNKCEKVIKKGKLEGRVGILKQLSKSSFRSLRKKSNIERHSSTGSKIERHSSIESTNSLNEKEVAKRQKQHFEDHQHRLEAMTEELSEMVEKPAGQIDRDGIINKTKTVEKYVGNILQYVDEEF